MISLFLVLFLTSYSYGLPDGFIYTGDLNLTRPILVSLRYGTSNNFVGDVIRGYENIPARGAVVSAEAGEALAKAQEEFLKDGYQIVIYDSYRPTKAVDHFMEWSENSKEDENVKRIYYPNVDKGDLFDLGYIAARSGHSKGSTIDLTLIKVGDTLASIQVLERTLNDNYRIFYVDDGTVNMGSSFDIFDEVSHYDNPYIFDEHRANREYLKSVMESAGFASYDQEWWHFRLINEPFPSTYFDFEMSEGSNQGVLMKANSSIVFIYVTVVMLLKFVFIFY
ncbi:D-alanyl-D-alanine dipeptidase [Pseudolycoriella hygida]|uniref:D-alanyl-D-alanine dipeptidase n=1 Tax=Pseudolycoriella hygida TaxID=35572 RepID=A0A9Q0S8Y5_9DIPT|nr:D-alanyl-D-alanine dipeptidase [Pseudolycoriella hygida]